MRLGLFAQENMDNLNKWMFAWWVCELHKKLQQPI